MKKKNCKVNKEDIGTRNNVNVTNEKKKNNKMNKEDTGTKNRTLYSKF